MTMTATSGYTRTADQVILQAPRIAKKMNHRSVRTEHILLALLDTKDGLASQVFNSLGLNRPEIAEHIGTLVSDETNIPAVDELPWDSHVKLILSLAVKERDAVEADIIGTEHILLGVLLVAGIAKRVLDNAGVTEDSIREAIATTSADQLLKRADEVVTVNKNVPSRDHVDRLAYFVYSVSRKISGDDLQQIVEGMDLFDQANPAPELISYYKGVAGKILEGN